MVSAIRASKGKPVDLETILERVDPQVGGGVYVATRDPAKGEPVEELTRQDYDAAVRRYHEGFALDVRHVMSSSPMRAVAA